VTMALYISIATSMLMTLASTARAESRISKAPELRSGLSKDGISGKAPTPLVATSNQLSRSVTTSAGAVRTIGGNTEEVFVMCKAHECDTTAFVIFFSQYGDVAKTRRALIPLENKRNFLEVTGDIMEHVDPIFFGDPKTAAFKALGLN
jgi:hypothetical protein